MHRGFRYKLAPTPDQKTLFRQFAGVCRLVYNLALEQRSLWGRRYRIGFALQCRELTLLRAELDWIAAVSQTCQQQALRDLDKAFANFFAGRAGFPTPRRRGVNDAFRFQGREVATRRLNAKWSAVLLPKIGWVKFRDTRPRQGDVKNVTVVLELRRLVRQLRLRDRPRSAGQHLSGGRNRPRRRQYAGAVDRRAPVPARLARSDRATPAPRSARAGEEEARLAAADQSRQARRPAGGARRARPSRLGAQGGARRRQSVRDGRGRGSEGQGDDRVGQGAVAAPGKNVRAKAGLNRAILRQGWTLFEGLLAYKLEERGGALVKVDPAYTSQTCSACGAVDGEARESQAVFSCRRCGFRADADENAAINILAAGLGGGGILNLRRNTASMRAEDGHWPADETRTGGGFAPAENPPASARGRC